MVPLQTLADRAVGWLTLTAALLVPGGVATLLTAPALLSARLRSLFERLPPFDSAVLTFGCYGVLASLPYVLGVLGALVGTEIEGPRGGGRMGNAILDVVVPVTAVYVVGVPVACAVGLPRLGIDWDPTGYGVTTWLLLAVASAWYAALFAVPLFVLAIIVSFPG